MSITLQWIIVGLLIAAAAFYFVRLILRSRHDPCRGCPAAELCRKKHGKAPSCSCGCSHSTCEKNR